MEEKTIGYVHSIETFGSVDGPVTSAIRVTSVVVQRLAERVFLFSPFG